MVINGLESVDKFTPKPLPSTDGLDVSREVNETTAMLKYLGVVSDEDEAREDLTSDYQSLKGTLNANGQAVEGRLHVVPSINVIPRAELLQAVRHILGKDNLCIYDQLWTPARGKADGYTTSQLKKAAPKTEAAMALHSNNKNNPLLHFTGQPFDEVYARKGETTQLDSLAGFKQEFDTAHPDRVIAPLGDAAVLGMAIEDKIAGRDNLPLDWGFMRVATLPRVSAGGYSLVGNVYSHGSGVDLGGSGGGAHSDVGVGVSMGLKKS